LYSLLCLLAYDLIWYTTQALPPTESFQEPPAQWLATGKLPAPLVNPPDEAAAALARMWREKGVPSYLFQSLVGLLRMQSLNQYRRRDDPNANPEFYVGKATQQQEYIYAVLNIPIPAGRWVWG